MKMSRSKITKSNKIMSKLMMVINWKQIPTTKVKVNVFKLKNIIFI